MFEDHNLRRAGRAALTAILTAGLAWPYPTTWAGAETIEEMEQNIESLRQEEAAARAAQEAAEAESVAAQQEAAVLEAEVAEAQERLNALYQEAEACENDLITITTQLEQTEARIAELTEQIAQTTKELEDTRQDLADIIADSYKNGRPSLLSVALSASDFDDFVARITYANKVAQHETDVVNRVNELKQQLEGEKAEQEQVRELQKQQKAEQEEKMAALEAAVAELEDYRAQLSEEILVKISEAQAAAQQAAIEAARAQEAADERLAQEHAKAEAEAEIRRQAEEEARRRAEEAAAAAAARGDSSSGSSGGDEAPRRSYGYGATDVSSFVSAAYGIIGSSYSWSGYNWTGSTSSSYFTCSGVVDYALGRPPRASSPETLYAEVGAGMVHSTGALNYGDLVFYASGGRYPGHVGIYIGGGQIIDAIPGGVAIRDVNYMNFIGGGPII